MSAKLCDCQKGNESSKMVSCCRHTVGSLLLPFYLLKAQRERRGREK